ncbi:MAG: hypothetical protein K2Y37_13800 [Pirellulales bacterium]|nr:hypothetical protein [Pirellulales bacterium]
MKYIFADSFYFFALLNPRDQAHARAIELSSELSRPLVTTAWVLTEVADGLAATPKRQHFGRLLGALQSEPSNRLIESSHELFERGTALYLSPNDKAWTLTDCTSFVVMADLGITDALTGDHHFGQAGFNPLLS